MSKRKCACHDGCLEEGELRSINDNEESFNKQMESYVVDPCVEKFFSEVSQMDNFWKEVDKQTEKLVCEPSWNLSLVGESTYFLNKSHSKWVCVGLLPDNFFKPIVKIVGVRKQCIVFNPEEWEEFMMQSAKLKKYFDYGGGKFPRMSIWNLQVSSESFDGVNRVLKMDKDGDLLYLSYEGLSELWRMRKLLESRLESLRHLKYDEFYKDVIQYLAVNGKDLNMEIEKVLQGSPLECVCITKEMLVYHLRKVYEDVDLLRKNRN